MTLRTPTAVPLTARFSLIAHVLTTLARRVRKLPTALAHRDQLRRLAECDDHVLADIGLTRQDIDAALSAPFWRDPTEQLVRRLGELKADPRCQTVGESARDSGPSVVSSPQLILAACNRHPLPVSPTYLAGR